MTLTREAIHFVNEFYRLTDDINNACFDGPNATVGLEAQRKTVRAKFTDAQFAPPTTMPGSGRRISSDRTYTTCGSPRTFPSSPSNPGC